MSFFGLLRLLSIILLTTSCLLQGAVAGVISETNSITQQAYMKASNTGHNDHFGQVIAMSGDTLVISSPFESSATTGVNGNQNDNFKAGAGAVYVFKREENSWIQEAYIKASNTDAFDSFGYSIAISGDTLVVGAHNEDSTATGINGNQSDNSAEAVGAAYVFTRTNGVWTQEAYLKASNAEENDMFGYSVAINEETIAIGALNESSDATGVNGNQNNNNRFQSGAIYLFQRDTGGTWAQQAYVKAFDTENLQHFGESVTLSDSILAVGSSWKTVNGEANTGVVYVYELSSTNWLQAAYLTASNLGGNDNFGHSVGLFENTLVVGARKESGSGVGINPTHDDDTQNSGAVYVFERINGEWIEQAYVKPSNTDEADQFGWSVSVTTNKFIVGALRESSDASGVDGHPFNNNYFESGAAYLFEKSDGQWSQSAYLKASNTGVSDNFGMAVAITNDLLVVGAHLEDSSSVGIGGDQDNEDEQSSGAVYVFIDGLIFADGFD